MRTRPVDRLIRDALAERGISPSQLGPTERIRDEVVALFAQDVIAASSPSPLDQGPVGSSRASVRVKTPLHASLIHERLPAAGGDPERLERLYRLWADQGYDPAWRYLKANAGDGFGEVDRPVRFDPVHLPVRVAGRAAYLLSLLRESPVHLDVGGERFVVDAARRSVHGPAGPMLVTLASAVSPGLEVVGR